jgi:predicted RNase H-like nuclease
VTRRVLGADGCPDGWVTVTLVDGQVDEVEVVPDLLEAVAQGFDAVAVDMPIGLVDAAREADIAARELLPGRASSVFPTPPAVVVDGWRRGELTSHASASAAARDVTGSGLSQQAWRLVPKIAHVDDLVAAGHPLWEVHPEVAFAIVVGEPLPRKRSWAGVTTRRSVLDHLGVRLPDRFPGDTSTAPDDVLDAAICAWVADAIPARQPLLQLPPAPTQQAHGRAIAMLARVPDDRPPGAPRAT